jgi:hypothetical protein
MFGFAGENGTNFDFLNGRIFNHFADFLGEFISSMSYQFSCQWVIDVVDRSTTQDLFSKGYDHILSFLESGSGQSAKSTAVF